MGGTIKSVDTDHTNIFFNMFEERPHMCLMVKRPQTFDHIVYIHNAILVPYSLLMTYVREVSKLPVLSVT